MPKIIVEIEWDVPEDFKWLNAYNVEAVLKNHCVNTKFKVTEIPEIDFSEILKGNKNE